MHLSSGIKGASKDLQPLDWGLSLGSAASRWGLGMVELPLSSDYRLPLFLWCMCYCYDNRVVLHGHRLRWRIW